MEISKKSEAHRALLSIGLLKGGWKRNEEEREREREMSAGGQGEEEEGVTLRRQRRLLAQLRLPSVLLFSASGDPENQVGLALWLASGPAVDWPWRLTNGACWSERRGAADGTPTLTLLPIRPGLKRVPQKVNESE